MKRMRILIGACLAISIAVHQAHAANVLFVGGQADAAQGDDSFVLEHLEDVLMHDVTYLTGDESATGDVDGQDLLIISSTLGSGSARGKFQDEEIPIMQWEEALIRWNHGEPDGNFRMAEQSRNGQGRETTFIEITPEGEGHPLAAGLAAGVHEIFEFENRTPQSFGELPSGLLRIGALDPDWAEEAVSFWNDENGDEVEGPEFVLTAIDKGVELGPEGDGFFAPEKRVNFPIEDTGFSILNDVGLSLFDASVNWLLGEGVNPPAGGDYDNNGLVDAADVDLQAAAMKDPNPDLATFDEDADGKVDFADRSIWVHDHANTWVGDSNLDGEFNSGDLVAVFTAGKYELDEMAGWAEGDWDGDMRFGSGDLVAAFTDGGYELGPPANAVPEPSSMAMLLVSGLVLVVRRRR